MARAARCANVAHGGVRRRTALAQTAKDARTMEMLEAFAARGEQACNLLSSEDDAWRRAWLSARSRDEERGDGAPWLRCA